LRVVVEVVVEITLAITAAAVAVRGVFALAQAWLSRLVICTP